MRCHVFCFHYLANLFSNSPAEKGGKHEIEQYLMGEANKSPKQELHYHEVVTSGIFNNWELKPLFPTPFFSLA